MGSRAGISVGIHHLPNHNDDADLAIKEIAKGLEDIDGYIDSHGGVRKEGNNQGTVLTTHQGQPALSQRIIWTPLPPLGALHCVVIEDTLVVLSRLWSTDTKAFYMSGSRCLDDTRRGEDIAKAISSFKLPE